MEVLLGVTGCIGAYKAADIVRRLRTAGVGVRVILTRHAGWFVTEGTLQTLSGRPVYTDMFRPKTAARIEHIELPRAADLLLVAPATANVIGKLARGIADDFLSTVYLAYEGPVILAPAMNTTMYRHPAVQRNLEILVARGVEIVGPAAGDLACGDVGEGRLLDPEAIVAAVLHRLGATRDWTGRRLLVTAGPTREFVDPVRFLSNPSSGRMGFAVARAASRRGAAVTLICGPTSVTPPEGVEVVRVTGAREMHREVLARWRQAEVVVMAAAVGDYEAGEARPQKMKKTAGGALTLTLVPTPDILAELGRLRGGGDRPILVGFAAETERVREHALAKLRSKGVDYVLANPIGEPDAGFEAETNRVTLLGRDGAAEDWPLMSKNEVAERLLERLAARLAAAGAPVPPTPER